MEWVMWKLRSTLSLLLERVVPKLRIIQKKFEESMVRNMEYLSGLGKNNQVTPIFTFTLPLLYNTLFRPFLEYGNVCWGSFNRCDLMLIERV